MINLQGIKLAVAPLEERVQTMLGVESVCLFSALNDEGEEELVIVIEGGNAPSKGATDEVLSLFRRFENIRFKTVDEFPRTEAGMQKVDRLELRRRVFGAV